MMIREMRVRYQLTSAYGFPVVNAVVCPFYMLKSYVEEVKRVGYKLVGIDERFRDEKERMELDEGWTEVHPVRR